MHLYAMHHWEMRKRIGMHVCDYFINILVSGNEMMINTQDTAEEAEVQKAIIAKTRNAGDSGSIWAANYTEKKTAGISG